MVVKKIEYGFVPFGKFKGNRWSSLPKDYLSFIISDDCYTSQANKEIAKKELQQREVVDGQEELF